MSLEDLSEMLEKWLPPEPEPEPEPRGVVYLIEAEGCARVKIGFTRDLHRRLQSIQTSCPFPVSVVAELDGDEDLEAELHRRFSAYRVMRKSEWFHMSPAIRKFIEEET